MDTSGKFASHLDHQLGIPYELLDDLSVREQRVIVKRRIQELREIENYKIRSMTKSPTKPIDTQTNTRLFLKQLDKRVLSPTDTQFGSSTLQTQFERRSRSNLPYSKKPGTTRSDLSDVFGDVTTAATASPTFRHALSIGGSEYKTPNNRLEEVSEVPLPRGIASNHYRKSRLLAKGCPKLIRLVEKHQVDLEKSLESQKYSQRMISYRDRIKMSIMTTRAKTNNTPSAMDEVTRGALSGLNQNRNAYNLKKQLIRA